MLDNFDAEGLRQAAATVKDKCPHVTIEASGVGGTTSAQATL
jgi:nicotinate-nucleotide pyrophosphorylase